MKCSEIIEYLETLSPKKYACEWDNVGLLVGRSEKEIHRILIALDATESVVKMAADCNADMLITHHPVLFSPIKQVNEDHFTAKKVLTLAEQGICCYAMHTNYDIVGGMAELAASEQYLDLSDVKPMTIEAEEHEGLGRFGRLPSPMTARQVAEYVKERFNLSFVMLYQKKEDRERIYHDIAVLPGSGKSELKTVKKEGYSLYLTGDFGHHEGIDAMDMGVTVIDATHYGLEHIFIDFITKYLKEKLKNENVEIIPVDTGCPIDII
ncbi:MAG: Nif3-like dinuclear metal center hexameric protein [Lachnospiraceae bacterium]|nr:Nif3-like dinuclear metal center hexameric protein [Lachnospiraceae bacterium]